MGRNTVRGEKWGLHPISARTPKDETLGEASSRWNLPGASAQFRSGSSAGASERAPRLFSGGLHVPASNLAILSEVMASGAELIRQIKEQIEEVDPKEVHDLGERQRERRPVIVDVREQHEFEQSHLPGRRPRAARPSRVAHRGRGRTSDRAAVILYCASGNRSALAAHTLQRQLGYENVESMSGGITLWKDRGYEVEVPRALTPEQRERYSRHTLIPEIGARGPAEAARRQGAAARRRRARLADRALPRGGRRRHARHRRQRRRRPVEPPAPGRALERPHRRCRRSTRPRSSIKEINPDVKVEKYHDAARRLEHHGDHPGLRRRSSTASTTSRRATC